MHVHICVRVCVSLYLCLHECVHKHEDFWLKKCQHLVIQVLSNHIKPALRQAAKRVAMATK